MHRNMNWINYDDAPDQEDEGVKTLCEDVNATMQVSTEKNHMKQTVHTSASHTDPMPISGQDTGTLDTLPIVVERRWHPEDDRQPYTWQEFLEEAALQCWHRPDNNTIMRRALEMWHESSTTKEILDSFKSRRH